MFTVTLFFQKRKTIKRHSYTYLITLIPILKTSGRLQTNGETDNLRGRRV